MYLLSSWLFVSFGVWKNFWGCVWGWKKSNQKDRRGKKKVAECIHFHGFDYWKSKCKRERERVCVCVCVCCLCKWKFERECVVSISQNEEKEFFKDESIYRQSLSCDRLQIKVADIVVSTNHVTSWPIGSRDWLGYWHPPSLFQEQVASWPF